MAADLVVHAAGRQPDLEALDLTAGGFATENGRIELNEFLQSVSNPTVYAACDAEGIGPALTPLSRHDGCGVVKNLLDSNRRPPDYRGVPSIAFTNPPIAAAGNQRFWPHRLTAKDLHTTISAHPMEASDIGYMMWFLLAFT